VALLAMALLLVLASTFLGTSSTEMEIAANARDAARALYLAESGLARLQRDLLTQFAGPYRARCPALPTFATLRRPLLLTGEPLGLPGQRLDADGSATCGPPGAAAFYPILDEGNQPVSPEGPTWRTIPYAAAGTDGEYRVEVRNATADTLEARVRAGIGAATGASRHLEATLQVARFSPAEHAVFVDGGIWPLRSEGAQGPLLIAGPVFAKGWSGTYPALRLGYGGAADRIVNWYRGMDAALQAAVPPLAAGSAGEASLGATVRVFQGPVEVSHAAASVGEPSLPGNGLKEALDGVYTNHGFTGNPGASAVYADTGAGGRFDLPRELVAFPDLGGPYTGPPLPGGTDPPSHDASLRDGALGIEGGLVVDANTPSFSYPPGYSDLRECAGPCLIYRSGQVAADGTPASPPALRIQGIVWVKGDIALGGLGAQRLPAIRYEGSGTLYARAGAAADVPATGSITVTADLLPPPGLPAPSDPSGAAGPCWVTGRVIRSRARDPARPRSGSLPACSRISACTTTGHTRLPDP
jgi:hypothetical protein